MDEIKQGPLDTSKGRNVPSMEQDHVWERGGEKFLGQGNRRTIKKEESERRDI